jgi:hypothetical protein
MNKNVIYQHKEGSRKEKEKRLKSNRTHKYISELRQKELFIQEGLLFASKEGRKEKCE